MEDSSVGPCVCSDGYFHNSTANTCQPCGEGEAVNLEGTGCVPADQCGDKLAEVVEIAGFDRCVCVANATYSENGCTCNQGTYLSLDRKACGACPSNARAINGSCTCLTGFDAYTLNNATFCAPKACPIGQALNGTSATESQLNITVATTATSANLFCSACNPGWIQDGSGIFCTSCENTRSFGNLN